MKTRFVISILLAAASRALLAAPANFGWAESLDVAADWNTAIAADPASNVFIGYAQALNNTPTGNWAIKKVDQTGNVLWTKTLKTTARISVMATDSGGACYLAGTAPTNAFSNIPVTPAGAGGVYVVKYTVSGDLDWIRLEGGSQNVWLSALSIDGKDNLYLAGLYSGAASFRAVVLPETSGPDDSRMFLAKYNANGSVAWVRTGVAYPPEGKLIATDSDGNAYVGVSALDQNLQSVTFGNITATGSACFVVKYDRDGNVVWVNPVTMPVAHGYPGAVAADKAGNAFVLTWFMGDGTSDGDGSAVTKFSPDGTLQWQQSFSIPYLHGDDLVVEPDGGCLMGLRYDYAGGPATFGTNTFETIGEYDMAVLKFTPTGDLRWAISSVAKSAKVRNGVNVNGSDIRETRLAMAPNGLCYASAAFENAFEFGQSQVVAASGQNSYMTALLATIVDPEVVYAMPPPPTLQISRSGAGLLLSWAASATGFFAESANSLSPSTEWAAVGGVLAATADLNLMQLDPPAAPTFYRLRKP
jgi:hypothetical protein